MDSSDLLKKEKISDVLTLHGLFQADIKSRFKNGQIFLNGFQVKDDEEVEINNNYKIHDAGEWFSCNIVTDKIKYTLALIIGNEFLFRKDLNFKNKIAEEFNGFSILKISKKEILIIG